MREGTDRFAVRLAIDTPISLRGLLHLDGLLMRLAADAGSNPLDIPLAATGGVRHGSAAMLECGVFGPGHEKHVTVKALREDQIPAGVFSHLRPTSLVVRDMTPQRPALAEYPLTTGIRAVWFAATGDRDATLDLLAGIRNLGAMGRMGYGRVVDVDCLDVEDGYPTGLALRDGSPARTVAKAAWLAIGMTDHPGAVTSMRNCAPPYWTGEEVECISPTQEALTGTRSELARLAGAR